MNDAADKSHYLRHAFNEQDNRFARAFAILNEAIVEQDFPGASIAVTVGEELVALKGLGRFTYENSSPEVHPKTVFDLASVSKVVATTTIAMLLYEGGQLDLDMPLAGVMPEFVSLESDARRKEVSIRMLLAHSSGLPAYERLFERSHTHDELLHAACSLPLTALPGTKSEYSDIGFILLGEALSRIADEPLDTFCQREIFGPLGLTKTTFRPSQQWKHQIPPTEDDRTFRHRVIQGEVNDENAFVMGGVAGHAGVFSTAFDMAMFARTMLAGGTPILRRDTVDLFTCGEHSQRGNSRKLGWDTPSVPSQSGSHFSQCSFGHLGFTGTSLWIDPERQISVTLLTNRTWPDRRSQGIKKVRPKVHDAIMHALLA